MLIVVETAEEKQSSIRTWTSIKLFNTKPSLVFFFMSMPKPTRADLMHFLVKMLSPLELNNKKMKAAFVIIALNVSLQLRLWHQHSGV